MIIINYLCIINTNESNTIRQHNSFVTTTVAFHKNKFIKKL